MSLRNLKRNLWRTAGFWLVALCGVALLPVARTPIEAQGRNSATASVKAGPASLQMGQYWTAEMMANAIPMERTIEAWQGSAPASTVQNLGRGATSGVAEGFDPARGLAAFAALVQKGPFQIMTSPPFTPPANPTDFGNYAPFQRWTHFGQYSTFPISTVGKLFFSQGGGNFVCSASVVNRNTIATAGHCVAAGNNSTWSSNFVFCPSYTPGGCVGGSWGWVYAATSGQWFSSGLPDRDYACISTNQPGGAMVGNQTGWTGRAWNFPTRQAEFALGYPQAAPFPGHHIITTTSTEWYEQNFAADAPTNHVSKYIGSDQTGGSSGGPWWLSYRHPNAAFDYPDTDGSGITDPGSPGGPYINGVNSHKRCNAGGCPAGSIFTQEMGSPQFLNTADGGEFEDVFALCAANGGS